MLKEYRVRFNAQQGEILDSLDERGMIVATGDNCILIKMVEVNGEQISGDEFLRRYEINQGNILGEPQ